MCSLKMNMVIYGIEWHGIMVWTNAFRKPFSVISPQSIVPSSWLHNISVVCIRFISYVCCDDANYIARSSQSAISLIWDTQCPLYDAHNDKSLTKVTQMQNAGSLHHASSSQDAVF